MFLSDAQRLRIEFALGLPDSDNAMIISEPRRLPDAGTRCAS
jgi:hypothetical protein